MNEKKVRILAIVPSAFCFGLQHITLQLFDQLGLVWDAHFLVTRWNDGEFIRRLKELNLSYSLSWLGMFSRKMDWKNIRMTVHALSKLPRLYLDFRKIIREHRPDILFFANHHEMILLLPMLWNSKVPVICHMHDPSPAIPFQKFTFWLYDRVVTRYVAISHDVAGRLRALGCPPSKIEVIHNGVKLPSGAVDKSNFRNKWGFGESDFVIGIAGQMTATKGHEDLLEAFRKVRLIHPNLRVMIGGRKMEPLYQILTQWIDRYNLSNSVIFTDWISDMSSFYQSIDLFVLASRHDEGYGLVVAESMAAGTPALITASGGAQEIVQHGKTGWITEKNNPETMASALCYLLDHPDEYHEVKRQVSRRIQDEFTLEVMADRFSRFVSSLIRPYGIRP